MRWLGHVQKTDGGDTGQTILNLELSVKRKPTVGHANGWSNRKLWKGQGEMEQMLW